MKNHFTQLTFDDPNYLPWMLLCTASGIFIYLQIEAFMLDREQARIQEAVTRLSTEEMVFDQRTAVEGIPPFLSWERKTKTK